MDIYKILAEECGVRKEQVEAAVQLIDEGSTIPFIARYRKELTGAMDDEALRKLDTRLTYLRNLEEKKAQVLSVIEEQGNLTPELKKAIEDAQTMVLLEDLYRPYRPKKKTRASVAKERGLEPLANLLLLQRSKRSAEEEAKAYVSPEKEVPDEAAAIAGALDILAEGFSEDADLRGRVRDLTYKKGLLVTSAKDPDSKTVYDMYYAFQEAVNKIPGHRVLAINRGEKEKILTVKLEAPEEEILQFLGKRILVKDGSFRELLEECIKDSYNRLMAPAIARDIRNELSEKAEDGAIVVFQKNLEQLLMQPPMSGQIVLGWDPGFAHGCKLAVVDATGKVLDTAVVYATAPNSKSSLPKEKLDRAKSIVRKMMEKHGVTLISLGNGTASRESELIIADLLKEMKSKASYVITNEAGASVYSASKLAAEEFPDFTVEQRGAASIARRVQDPLAELVKIDPGAIGVGQYQHDMNQKKLGEALSGVVEFCVNKVGVDLNTASAPLMEYVSGISKTLAKNIVAYREEKGRFTSRRELLKVPKLGPKAFEQCAGFMRITGGKEPLDATGVHPESYKAVEALAELLACPVEMLFGEKQPDVKDKAQMAKALEIGELTLTDILNELRKPGRDPRADLPLPVLRSDVLSMEDLKEGMVLKGTVRNVIDFGAFVDIGVHQDGLVHISKLSKKKFVKHPLEVVKVGDVVEVTVIGVDLAKKRISLSMIG